jgi:hypothetical protein
VSLDYPYYEELRRQGHRAAWWWLVGDRLYYFGLLPAVLALPAAAVLFVAWLLGLGEHYLTVAGLAALTFPVAVLVFVVGSSAKRHAYTLAERDGISAAEVYARGAAGGCQDAESGAALDPARDSGSGSS